MNHNLRELFGSGRDFANTKVEDILDRMGLQKIPTTASYVLPALGLFGIGMMVGAGLGLLFAPKSGHDLRENIGARASKLARRVGVGGHGGEELGAEDVGYPGGRGYEATGVGTSYEAKGTYPGGGQGGV